MSPLCPALATRGQAGNEGPLGGQADPVVLGDALGVKVRREEAGWATRAVMVAGSNEAGRRELLGLWRGDRESEGPWTDMVAGLTRRGWRGGEGRVSDDPAGLVKAVQRPFQGLSWPRCQVHLQRPVWGRTPRHRRGPMATGRRRIFPAADRLAARAAFAAVAAGLEGKADRARASLEAGLDEALAGLSLPETYRVRRRTTKGLERLNEEIRRRERGIRIVPNAASARRRIGAFWAAPHAVWSTGTRDVDMAEYDEWQMTQTQEVTQENRNVR